MFTSDPENARKILKKAEEKTKKELKQIQELIKKANKEITYKSEEFLLTHGHTTAFRPNEIYIHELGKEWQIKKAFTPYSLIGEILLLEDKREKPYKISRPYKILGYLAQEEKDDPIYPWRIYWITLHENSHIIKFLSYST